MIKEVYDSLPEELKEIELKTLKKVSKDSTNSEFMIESEMEVIDFDKISKVYGHRKKVPCQPKTNDALYVTKEGKWIFVEFKNGSLKVQDIYRKIYDSLIMLNDLDLVDWDFCRKNISYILVYNEAKHSERFPQLQESKSRSKLQGQIRRSGRTVRNLHEIYKLKGYLLENASTYNEEEFEDYFVKKYEQIEKDLND